MTPFRLLLLLCILALWKVALFLILGRRDNALLIEVVLQVAVADLLIDDDVVLKVVVEAGRGVRVGPERRWWL